MAKLTKVQEENLHTTMVLCNYLGLLKIEQDCCYNGLEIISFSGTGDEGAAIFLQYYPETKTLDQVCWAHTEVIDLFDNVKMYAIEGFCKANGIKVSWL